MSFDDAINSEAVTRAKQGSESAMSRLFVAAYSTVRRQAKVVIQRRAGWFESPSDIAHGAIVRGWELLRRGRFHGGTWPAFRNWLRRIGNRNARDEWRKARRRQRLLEGAIDNGAIKVRVESADPRTAVHKAEYVERVRQLINGLEPIQAVVINDLLNGASTAEISNRVGLSVRRVEELIRAGLTAVVRGLRRAGYFDGRPPGVNRE